MDTMNGFGHHARGRPPAVLRSPRDTPMTDAERRIIEFLMSDATRAAELPDWMLALLESDRMSSATS